MALGQQASAAVERIVFVAAVAEGLVLDAAAALVDFGVGVFGDMERVSWTASGRLSV